MVWFWFLGRCQDGLVLVPRETCVCVSTHYRVETFIGVNSGDVSQDGLVLFPREMSR